MKITVPRYVPYYEGPQPKGNKATIGDTGRAQYGKIFDPILSQLRFETQEYGEYDPDSFDRVENYIEVNGLNDREARVLRKIGIGSEENFNAAIAKLDRMASYESAISRSTNGALFLTDPVNHVSIFLPPAANRLLQGGAALAKYAAKRQIAKQTARQRFEEIANNTYFNNIKPVNNAYQELTSLTSVVAANATMRNKKLTASQLARIGALDAGISEGTISFTEALTEISYGEDPLEELQNAAIYTTAMTTLGYGAGYGLGVAMGAPLKKNYARIRNKTVSQNYKEYLNGVSDKPIERGEDLSFTGKWFAESWFMKAVPTPVRDAINDKLLPDWVKKDLLILAGDNGMPFVMNQKGDSVGSSVYIDAGRRQGDWYAALEVIEQNYAKVSPRGNAKIANVPVGEYVEKVRRKIGKDSFAPDEWYNHIGRLVIDEVPYDKMTPEEAASTQAFVSFMEKYELELTEVGLINSGDILSDNYLKTIGKAGEVMSLTRSIIEQNRTWMGEQVKQLDEILEPKQKILSDLNSKFESQGLNKSQLSLRNKVSREIADLNKRKQYFDDLFEKIEEASTIDELAALGPKLDLTESMAATLGDLSAQLTKVRARIDNAVEILNKSRSGRVKRNHFPRIFNRRAIEADRDGFKNILMKFFRENPEMISQGDDGLLKTVRLSTDPKDIELRAEQTIENIMGESDDDAIDAMLSGVGKSGPLVSRRLNIPNHLIKDFIVTDVKEVMIGYTSKVAPKLEYHKRFRDPKTGKLMSLEKRVDYYRTELRKAGVPERNIDRYIKNFIASYDRIVGTTLKRPDAIDTKAANFLRTATNWTFLGGSGVAAIGDAASVFMDHELNTLGKAFLGSMDDIDLKMSAKELKLAGEALEIIRGTTHLKYMESLSNDMFTKTMPDRLNNAFYIMNLLAPVTVAVKNMNGLLYGHSIIDYSMKLIDGTANKFEREFLARYNITPDLAKRISDMPHESSQGGLRLPNTEAWTDEDAVIAFRNALNSTVMNRVIMGTPADKPLMMDGVAYIPDHIAKLLPFDLPVDPRVQGYRRAESGLLALPFTFYSYTMGALSKITANHAAGAVRNRMAHAAASMALGYTIVKVRTPSWAWDDMDFEDKVARSFDFSGLAAIYSDIGYRAIAMANEMGVESSFPIQPKFDGGTDKLGALVSLGGAPADWTYEVLSSASQMVTGDVQGGAKGLVKMTPFLTTVMTGDILKDMAMEATSVLPNRP